MEEIVNETEHVMFDYPDLELGHKSQIVLITLFTATAILSVGGNLLVMVVLSCGTANKTTLTHYLLNLALADLCMACFCIPFNFTNTMLGHWIFGAAMCPIVLFSQVTSVGVSIFTNTAIGWDRYVQL